MIEVCQDIYGPPHGNCFAACVASILEIDDLALVPNYHAPTTWWTHGWAPWLANLGLQGQSPLILDERGEPTTDEMVLRPTQIAGLWPGLPWIASGPSPRGDWGHAVVYGPDGRLAWDPFPGGRGIAYVTGATALVPLDGDGEAGDE